MRSSTGGFSDLVAKSETRRQTLTEISPVCAPSDAVLTFLITAIEDGVGGCFVGMERWLF